MEQVIVRISIIFCHFLHSVAVDASLHQESAVAHQLPFLIVLSEFLNRKSSMNDKKDCYCPTKRYLCSTERVAGVRLPDLQRTHLDIRPIEFAVSPECRVDEPAKTHKSGENYDDLIGECVVYIFS